MTKLNSAFLTGFEKKGFSINEGMAEDARLVKSASKPISNDEIKKQRDNLKGLEGKSDKNGNTLKFSRDIESTG